MTDGVPAWAEDVPDWAQDKAQAKPSDDPSWGEVASGAASNFLPSAGNIVAGVADTVMHPITAAENIGSTIGGEAQLGAKKLGMNLGESYIPTAEAVNQFYADRYGGVANFKRALRDDPAGVMMDASTVFGAPEMALGRLPGIVGRASRAAGVAGRAMNPLNPGNVLGGLGRASRLGDADAAETMTQAGVNMTPGSIAGGIGKNVEDSLTSIPIIGSMVKSAKNRSIESFNEATANQALAPTGLRVTPGTRAGHDLINDVGDQLSARYDQVLAPVTMRPDTQMMNDLLAVRRQPRGISSATAPAQAQYDNLLHRLVFRPNAWMWTRQPNGILRPQMNGQMFKTIESDLKNEANAHRPGSPDDQKIARALDDVVTSLQGNLERQNPAQARALRDTNTSWAMFSRMREAASKPGAEEGVFRPNHLLQAIRSGDRSVGKGAFARGDALMQPFAEAGQRVLPSKVPDSGTPIRSWTTALLAGLTGAEEAKVGLLMHHPVGLGAAAGLVGVTAAAYSRPSIAALNAIRRHVRPNIPTGTIPMAGAKIPRIVVNALPPDQRDPDNPYSQP